MMKITEVVAALIWKDGKFLACQRPAHKARGLLWEFVGGKVEPGETMEAALIRECREELAVELAVGDMFMQVVHEYPDITVRLTLFNAKIVDGVPKMLEHNDIRWIHPAEIPQYDFCPADKDILAKLQHTAILETKRLILRPWQDEDAENLYRYAKDPSVGPPAGWPPHTSVEKSLEVIKNALAVPETYAVCLKDGTAIGSISLKLKGHTDMTDREDECELGYWIGKPFWGQGLIPEAAGELLRHAFEELGMRAVWCGYYEGNEKSHRVQEKLGFRYQYTTNDLDVRLMNEKRTGHTSLLTREQWEEIG